MVIDTVRDNLSRVGAAMAKTQNGCLPESKLLQII